MARRLRSRILFAGWGALAVGVAVLALECRRAPDAHQASRTVEEREKRRALLGSDERHSDERDLLARPARRVDASGAPCVLTGMVYGSDGKPASGADVTADALSGSGAAPRREREEDEDGSNDDEISATTDENGAFELEVPPGDYALSASIDEEISEVIDPLSLGAGERLDGLELHLGKGSTVNGRVELGPGWESPPDPSDVELCVLLHEHDESCFATANTGDDWGFELEALPVRSLWLRASIDEMRTVVAFTPPASGVVVRILPRPLIAGVVRAGGEPVERGEVLVNDVEGHLIDSVSIEEGGRFSLRAKARGAIVVWARSDDNGASSELTVDSDRASDLVLELHPGAAIVGRVLQRAGGHPFHDSRVCLSTARGHELGDVALDDDGRYRFTDVVAGHYTVAVCEWSSGTREPAGLPSVEVTASASGEARAPDLVVDRERTIRGRVLDSHGRPVPDAEVDLLASDGHMSSTIGFTDADENGEFVLGVKVVGPVTLRAWASDRVGERRTVGESVGVDEEFVELHVSDECQVSGVVRGEGGLPRGGARVLCGGVEHASTSAGRFDLGCACETAALTVDDGHGARLVPVHLRGDQGVYVEVRL
jgi:hypothetical protein